MKSIKKIKTITACIIAVALLTACNDWLDDVVPQGKILADTYMNDETTAEMAITGLYNLLTLTSGSGPDGLWLDNHFECYFGSMISDDSDKGSRPEDYMDLQRIVTYQWDPLLGFVRFFYVHGFWGVSRANYILDHLGASPLDSKLKQRMEGEARFFRAYYYFYLLRHYGGVPILTRQVVPSDFGNVPRASYTETAQFIIDELKLAATLLSPKDGSGRASTGSAKGLMARVMLYRLGTDPECTTTWKDLFDVTTEIVNSGEYALLPNYATLFEEETDGHYRTESLFEYTGKDGRSNSGLLLGEWGFQGVRGGSWAGWGFNQPTQDLVNAFDPTDPRLSCTVYGVGYNDGIVYGGMTNNGQKEPYNRGGEMMTNYYSRKWAVNGMSTLQLGTSKAIFIIRYADILLMRAEAAYHLGDEATARSMVNEVRARARQSSYAKGYLQNSLDYVYPATTPNLPDITSTGEQLLQDIWHERRLELAMENFRGYDLIRTGRLLERVGKVKDDQRPGGSGPLLTDNNADQEIRVPNIRENIRQNSLYITVPGNGGGERYIPILPIPPTEITYWNIDPSPNN